jgi:hypothetical protein
MARRKGESRGSCRLAACHKREVVANLHRKPCVVRTAFVRKTVDQLQGKCRVHLHVAERWVPWMELEHLTFGATSA